MRVNLRLTGTTPKGAECIADISVYVGESDRLDKKAEEAATYAVWFANQPGFPMLNDGVVVKFRHYRELEKPSRGSVQVMRMPGPLDDILSRILGGTKPKR